jgi:acyl carrier protein
MLNENKLKQVMAVVFKIDASSINETSSMDNIKTWDSLGHMNLILALEDEFKVTIPDEDAGNISSYKLIKIVLGELLSGVA